MKIAISTDQGQVSAHFGRCPEFTIVNIENGIVQKKETILNTEHQPGFLPQFLAEKKVECIVAGGMGNRAQTLFDQHHIETVIGITGTVDSVIQEILDGTLAGGASLCERAQGKCEHHNNKNT